MTTDTWAALVGFLLPALVAVINRESWRPWLKSVVALGTSVLGGTVTALLAGQFTGSTWIKAIAIAFSASQAFYFLWWKKSGVSDWIEQSISIGVGPSTEPVMGGSAGSSGGVTTATSKHLAE